MKDNTHPQYREVVYKDLASDFAMLTRSTIQTKETIVWTDGKEYPLAKGEVSSKSHPFYTGNDRRLDTTGRVEKFMNKYKNSPQQKKSK